MSSDRANFGILASGSYLPRWRIERKTITDAIGWARGRVRAGQGTRSFAAWDEDALTLAVEAGRAALEGLGAAPEKLRLQLASTSLPFADRSNAGIAREALGLPDDMAMLESSGSRRSGTSALIQTLESAQATLLCASDCVDPQPGSDGETEMGHGAAALIMGRGPILAEAVAWGSHSSDFVDRYRETDQRFEYRLEARWIRDAGTREPVKALIARVLEQAGVEPGDVHACLTDMPARVAAMVAKDAGLANARTQAEFEAANGLCGSAQTFLQLDKALGSAEEGQLLLLIGSGQGFDVILFRATGRGKPISPQPSVRIEENYNRYLGVRRLLSIDGGIRSERDNRSSQAAAARRHEDIHGLLGGRCSACGNLQFPLTQRCVHCHEADTQQPESMASMTGEVNSFTEDWLAWSPRPPLIFGNVHFPGKANIMMEFTDFDPGELVTGQAVRMAFRIKDFDDRRNFRRYFWKPAPMSSETTNG